ncbi:hypothetical protein BKA64DRAFT_268209 [Cadophora sp. MPI-SDFR-AT-0126]|nr:hypothetical protein BKA64DRAFT_268209 [Leotiomycetes sp. MPI-SDFR-AT-0126]
MEGMDKRLTPYIKTSHNGITPDASQISLNISADHRLSTTLPFQIKFTLKRARDGHSNPCIFHWNPSIHGFGATGFVLLHEPENGTIENVEIDRTGFVKLSGEKTPLVVRAGIHFLWELAPGNETTFVATLPERYHKVLAPAEKYHLVWPGSQINEWEWGTISEHANQELKPTSKDDDPQKPKLILPGGPSISFQALDESDPWPLRTMRERKIGFAAANLEEEKWRARQEKKKREQEERPSSPKPIEASERIPEAPILSVILHCPPEVPSGGIIDVQVKVTYEATQPARPITFHTHLFEVSDSPREGFRLYRHRDGDKWEKYVSPEETRSGFMIVDEPDIEVSPGQHEDFVSLRPGESWSTQRRIQAESWTTLPEDTDVGDEFRYRFNGVTLDWWDWGSREEHMHTMVKLPCWTASRVVEPDHNEGRPKLVVPASDTLEFRIV